MIERSGYLLLVMLLACACSCKSACAKEYPDVSKSKHTVFGRQLLEIDPPTASWGGEISPDGSRVLTANKTGGQDILWDAKTGDKIAEFELPSGAVNENISAFSPDGKVLYIPPGAFEDSDIIAGIGPVLRLVNPQNGQELETIRGPAFHNTCATGNLDLSGDGRFLVGSGCHNLIWMYDTNSWTVHDLTDNSTVVEPGFMALNTQGSILAKGYDHIIKLVNTRSNGSGPIINGHLGGITSLIFAKDGKRLFSSTNAANAETGVNISSYLAGTDATNVSDEQGAKMWDVETGKLLGTFSYNHTPLHVSTSSIALSPNEKTLVAAKSVRDYSQLVAYDVATQRIIDELDTSPAHLNSVSFTADGKTLCVISETVTVLLHVNNQE